MPTNVRVALGPRSYDIEIGHGNLAGLSQFIAQRYKFSHAVVVTDSNVLPRHGQSVARTLTAGGARVNLVSVPAGEASKCVAHLERMWKELLSLKADRRTLIVAVGGGVVGDLGGFLAATYARGLAFVQIPTTLLAQVDSSVGGKVGINLPAAKNIVGSFWQPTAVLIDLEMLQTLPDREFRSGLAEVVKYGVILDELFFAWLEQNADAILSRNPTALEHLVAHSCRLKAKVVEQDEREETGIRAILNYGHTFCHAIETVAGYGHYLHGEAVAIGMVAASRLAQQLGRISADVTDRQVALLTQLGLPTEVAGWDAQALLLAMQHDKKTENGKLRFVLPSRLGHVEVVADVPGELVLQVL